MAQPHGSGGISRALGRYIVLGQIRDCDPVTTATQFNWMMGASTNAAMLLGDAGIPSQPGLHAHAHETVRIFLSAYAMPGSAEIRSADLPAAT